jgi:D-3-phosphoglycerate dehydrogenase
LGDHNVDKQITDNKGDVSVSARLTPLTTISQWQVAYLMADISNVQASEIKDISDSLEALSCKFFVFQKAVC